MMVCGVDGMIAVQLNPDSDLKPVSHNSTEQTLLDNTAADECVFNLTFDENIRTVQSERHRSTRREFSLYFYVFCFTYYFTLYIAFSGAHCMSGLRWIRTYSCKKIVCGYQ